MKRSLLFLVAALFLFAAGPASAIYVSNCPQICTPTCPCSLQCQGPFGPTTCGQAGQACTGFADASETEADVELFSSFEDLLNSLEADAVLDLEAEMAQQVETAEELQATEPEANEAKE